MQTKGFIRILTIALLVICAFYLGFTFVSNHYQDKAEKKALAVAGIKSPDTSNKLYMTALNGYLDSIADKKVYPLLLSHFFNKGYTCFAKRLRRLLLQGVQEVGPQGQFGSDFP